MPTFAVIGDVHAHLPNLERVLAYLSGARIDAVLLVGDLGSDDLWFDAQRTARRDARWLASVADVLGRCGRLRVPVRYVPGNHDLKGLALPGNLDGAVEEIAGLRVAGIGGAGPARFGFPYEWDDDALRARELPEADVLLSHCPPYDTPIDLVRGGRFHAGSVAVRERALATRGFLVCGHIHEAPGAVRLGDCLCLNAGGLGEPYGRAQVGFVRRDASGDAVGHAFLDEEGPVRWFT